MSYIKEKGRAGRWRVLACALSLTVAAMAQYQGGENCATAVSIGGPLPIQLSGTTVGYANDYDETCPYGGSQAPDVVYSYTPDTDVVVDILLCNGWTDFDTKLYIYDSCPPAVGQPIACNDDACVSLAGQHYVSALWGIRLQAGVTYYLVVDGYGQEAGQYELLVRESLAQATCPGSGTVFGQPPETQFWWLPISDRGDNMFWRGSIQCDDFFGLEQRITGIHFWGSGLYYAVLPTGERRWQECREDPLPLTVTFYEDAGGRPGREACRYDLVLSGTLAGHLGYPQSEVYEYVATLDPPCALQRGWVSIVGGGAPTCWFAWLSSSAGNHRALADPWPYPSTVWPFDLSFCLLTDGGPAYGACCDDVTGECLENVALEDCAGRFTPATCAELQPACGQGRGACCASNGTCFTTTYAVCEDANCRGDMNCDGQVGIGDINPFVLALANPTRYQQQYPNCFLSNADTNGDGYVSFADINPFIPMLGTDCERTWGGLNSTCAACPPLRVLVPDDLPYHAWSTTCGRGNDHDATCLADYDSGEDLVYELVVTGGPALVEITLDPKGTPYAGLLLDDSFPPDGDCLAFRVGSDGTPFSLGCRPLDVGTYYVMIDSWAPPECLEKFELLIEHCTPTVGRCCYGDPPQCADVAEYECAALSGTWNPALTCATPCPDPAGEDCRHATPITSLPYAVEIDNRPATANGPAAPCDKYVPSGPMARDLWFVWTAPTDGLATVRVAGGLDPQHDLVLVVRDGCEQQAALYCADNDDGATGNEEQITFPAAAGQTYYFQVGDAGNHGRGTAPATFELKLATGSGACCLPDGSCQELGAVQCWHQAGKYQGDGTTCATTVCPQPTPGNNCADPIEVTLNSSTLPYIDVNGTRGRGNDYDDTCLGRFDDGEDIVYRLTVTETIVVRITLDPKGTQYAGFLLTSGCPPTGDCLVVRYGGTGRPHQVRYQVLSPGVYYLMVDKWLLPTYIPEFELRIEAAEAPTGACCVGGQCVGTMWAEECHAIGGNWFWNKQCGGGFTCPAADGETCANPIVINIPPQTQYWANHSTCGRGDAYNGNTCMMPYDGGEDTIYKIVVTGQPVTLEISASAMSNLVALALSDTCPPSKGCVFSATGWIPRVSLDPGEYYLMVDTLPGYWQPPYSWPNHCLSYQLSIRKRN